MPTIIVASQNPVKIEAAWRGFERLFPSHGTQHWQVRGVSVPSGVSIQPMTSEETRQGALQRAAAARAAHPDGDYWVGIEGGVEEDGENLAAFAWVAVLSNRGSGQSRTGTFFLPPPVAALVRQGHELGEADDIIFGRANSKQENGAIGLLTGNLIDRTALYEHAVILALLPFKNETLYLA